MFCYASIDIETLGLNPNTCDVIEFGCVLDDLQCRLPLDKLPQFHCYVTQPQDLYKGEVYAMYMHSKNKIFERIAKREEGFSYVPADLLDEVFAEWVAEHANLAPHDKLVIAGKNFQGFDMRFLRRLGFGTHTKLHHRTIDPGSMWFDPKVDLYVPPDLKTCLERAGFEDKDVEHTAIEDALDVIRCIRAKYPEEK